MKVSYISVITELAKIIENYSLFFRITLLIPVRCQRGRNEIWVANIRWNEWISFPIFFCIAIIWYLNMALLSSCFAITFSHFGSCLSSNDKVQPKSSSSLSSCKIDRDFSFLSLTISLILERIENSISSNNELLYDSFSLRFLLSIDFFLQSFSSDFPKSWSLFSDSGVCSPLS